MKEPPHSLPALEIWIDGRCEICRRSQRWCSARDKHGKLGFRDLHEQPVDDDPPGSREAMMASVHVRRPGGVVSTGFDAWCRILLELDGWRWLARFASLPGARRLGPAIYTLVAENRHRPRIRPS